MTKRSLHKAFEQSENGTTSPLVNNRNLLRIGKISAHNILGQDFSAIVAETAAEQAGRLAATLKVLYEQPVRFVRVANGFPAKLGLKRMLIQTGSVEAYANDEADQNSNEVLLREKLSERHEEEEHVLLVIEQAETLQPDVVPFLRALTAARNRNMPRLHVLFVGTSKLHDLGICVAEMPNRHPVCSMLSFKPRKMAAGAIIALGLLGFLINWADALFYRPVTVNAHAETTRSSLPSTELNALRAQLKASSTSRQIDQSAAGPAAPLPSPVLPLLGQSSDGTLRLRATFDQFLSSYGAPTEKLTRSQRDNLFQQYLVWRTWQAGRQSP